MESMVTFLLVWGIKGLVYLPISRTAKQLVWIMLSFLKAMLQLHGVLRAA